MDSCPTLQLRSETTFPRITGTGATVDILCKFFLIYRQDGSVKMFSPFRLYFLESAVVPAQRVEVIRWGLDYSPAPARTFLHHVSCGRRVTLFEAPPIFTRGPYPSSTTTPRTTSHQKTPYPTIPHHRGTSRKEWTRKFRSVMRSKYNNSDTFLSGSLILL